MRKNKTISAAQLQDMVMQGNAVVAKMTNKEGKAAELDGLVATKGGVVYRTTLSGVDQAEPYDVRHWTSPKSAIIGVSLASASGKSRRYTSTSARRVIWTSFMGAIPEGHDVFTKDGSANMSLGNLNLVKRGEK